MAKVLISTGFGAGWSTWNDKPKEVAEYLPIIEFLEAGGNPADLSDQVTDGVRTKHPLVLRMMDELGLSDFYTGGANDGLIVVEVDGPYLINEYDGSETLMTPVDFW